MLWVCRPELRPERVGVWSDKAIWGGACGVHVFYAQVRRRIRLPAQWRSLPLRNEQKPVQNSLPGHVKGIAFVSFLIMPAEEMGLSGGFAKK